MLTLYEHPFALYCQKVLVALNELGVAYDVLEEQRDFDRAELAQLWQPACLPVQGSRPRWTLAKGTACATTTYRTPSRRSSLTRSNSGSTSVRWTRRAAAS